MDLKVKLYIVDDKGEKFMGIGVLWLLERVESLGSLRAAAKDMTISYTKAYNMVKRLEATLGHEVLEMRRGGASHDGACLTAFGRRLCSLYRDFQQEAKERMMEPYGTFKSRLEEMMEERTDG